MPKLRPVRRGTAVRVGDHEDVSRRIPKRLFWPSLTNAMFCGVRGHGEQGAEISGRRETDEILLRKSLAADRIANQLWGQTQTIACQTMPRPRR